MWPGSLGMAASFDPSLVRELGDIASREYPALGITTALSPQIDLATDPRWYRVGGTFGEGPLLSADLETVLATRRAMKGKPLVVSVTLSSPMGFSELERQVDAIVVDFGVQDQAVLSVLSGETEPSGLLPPQMPADTRTVEEQSEDMPRDLRCFPE